MSAVWFVGSTCVGDGSFCTCLVAHEHRDAAGVDGMYVCTCVL